MPATTPRLFNIPASAPFLPVLIDALCAGKLVPGFPASRDPLELARATLYLPTRRACRLAREMFLERIEGEAAILPRIVAIGDIDEDEIIFADAANAALAEPALALPDAFKPLERRLTLAHLISKWAAAIEPTRGAPLIANTPATALALADDLARLLDDMITREVPWARLGQLVPGELDEYWKISLQFLQFVHPLWLNVLGERGAIEAAERRDRLIDAEANRLAANGGPVIAAGSTGSMPATAHLLTTIAGLQQGAVVLPGLDTDLDEQSWRAIAGGGDEPMPAAGHPQFAMQALLARIGTTREAVVTLAPLHGRDAFVSEIMRPAATTELWQKRLKDKGFQTIAEVAVEGLAMVEAGNAEEEALAVAVALREAVETPGKTAALVTADRTLAGRVLAALERWDVSVDDSGGDRLADTPAGLFARLAAETALGELAPVPLLALLKHPLLRLGAGPGAHNRAIAALERAVLRGPRPKSGSAGLLHALATFDADRARLHRSDPRGLIADYDLAAARALVEALQKALSPLENIKRARHTLTALASLHRDVVTALSDAVFDGLDGKKLETAFAELIESRAAASLSVQPDEYAEMFETIIAADTVRMREQPDVRIRILGPLEARLQSFDRVVLGGLNEGNWPPEARSDPWLSRPMRKDLGLNLPELRIGLAAHDFAQALGAGEVIITRAARIAGAPTVTSRFVQRLAALAGKERWQQVVDRGQVYALYARALDHPAEVKPAPRPEPEVLPEARPAQLSVTDIENWLRDPYTIYAKHVLRLIPLEAVDTEPGAADRGTFIHDAIGEFTKTFAGALPADVVSELTALGQKYFVPLQDFEEARAFWWTRFQRIAAWFETFERERRTNLQKIYAEISGRLPIPLGKATFALTARADRIEQRADGSYAILDYKTGQPPTDPQVRSGLAPQLTLEAAILRQGCFTDIAAGSVSEIAYVRLKGGEPPGECRPIKIPDGTPDTLADRALAKLTNVAQKFLVEGEPYRSLVHPMWTKHYGDYDHLARVKEWAASGGESEAEQWP